MTAAKKKTRKRSEAPRLSRDDWLDAAFMAVVEGGFDSARVLVLAQRLGVTRGSFYWHFADHAELVTALLQRWQNREIELDKSMQQQSHPDPAVDLENVLEIALAHAGPKLENMVFELAMRALARKDPSVAEILVKVDDARMALFEEKFLRLTGDPLKAMELAGLFYLAIVGGNQALSRPTTPPRVKQFVKGVIADYVIRKQAPATLPAKPSVNKKGAGKGV
jgi:AcrR family transcriptional regulator